MSISKCFQWPLSHLSSVMNRCCSAAGVNMMEWVAGRHILLLRGNQRGHLDSEHRSREPPSNAASHLLYSSSLALVSDIQKPFSPRAPPSALHHLPSCPSELLSAILFHWSLTCNVPLSTTGQASWWKGRNIYNKVNKASEKWGREVEEWVQWQWRLEKRLNIFTRLVLFTV